MLIIPNDGETPKAVNRLAREQMKLKLMNDILIDLQICQIEGWNPSEYISELHALIDDLSKSVPNRTNCQV